MDLETGRLGINILRRSGPTFMIAEEVTTVASWPCTKSALTHIEQAESAVFAQIAECRVVAIITVQTERQAIDRSAGQLHLASHFG